MMFIKVRCQDSQTVSQKDWQHLSLGKTQTEVTCFYERFINNEFQ